uniref:Uncharacterized protein n=1 Tax=Dromaius novaehollandiae TaxID=8790 RepID=A0A8C4JME0_DRONO
MAKINTVTLTEGYVGSLHESRHGSSVQIRRRKASGDPYWAYSAVSGGNSHFPPFAIGTHIPSFLHSCHLPAGFSYYSPASFHLFLVL